MATRERRVFPRDTVAHLWAVGAQDQARDAAHSFYFSGPTLLSYGQHFAIAHVLDSDCGQGFRRVLWNDASYSNTTSKHQTIARRALSREQWDHALHVPSLSADSARSIDAAMRAKRLPDYAATLLQRIRELIGSTAKMRHGSGPFVNALCDARKYQHTARAFYARAGKKYPLPDVPESNDDVPAGKAARNAWILTFARVLIIGEYRQALDQAADLLRAGLASSDPAAHQYDDPRSAARIVAGTYSAFERAERACFKAQTAYSALHAGKKSAAVGKMLRQLGPLLTSSRAAADAAACNLERVEFSAKVRWFYVEIARNRRDGTHGNYVVTRTDGLETYAYLERIGVQPGSVDHIAGMRMAALARAERVNRLSDDVLRDLKAGDDYFSNGNPAAGSFADAAACYRRALRTMGEPALQGPGLPAFRLRGLNDRTAVARERLQTIDARIAEQNAQRIADWISGASNHRPPYEAGTFARINGKMIETTRGASVPIEHACRLARVFDRVVSAGGHVWRDGSGPMVGHYRVNSIGADGSLVIGCHEFNSTEAQRLRDLLNACKECQGVTAESTDVEVTQ
jgi:hypothetical protein